jgi:uncharacterized protein (UPF0332 family)
MAEENKLAWCKSKAKGIRMITPNENVARSYLDDASKDMLTMIGLSNKSEKWVVVTAYYACYSALYSLCMKAGIKSEIHSCTIELMSMFGFTKEDKIFLTNLKLNREGVQYYRKKPLPVNVNVVKIFIDKCKDTFDELEFDKINNIREEVKNA